MSAIQAIRQSNTFSAYRYQDGDLIFARFSFSDNAVYFGDARGFESGQPVYPSPERCRNKFDWQPWQKGHALHAKLASPEVRK